MVKILAALVAALSILISSGASPGATEKVAALVARATCSGASHSSANDVNNYYVGMRRFQMCNCKIYIIHIYIHLQCRYYLMNLPAQYFKDGKI